MRHIVAIVTAAFGAGMFEYRLYIVIKRKSRICTCGSRRYGFDYLCGSMRASHHKAGESGQKNQKFQNRFISMQFIYSML